MSRGDRTRGGAVLGVATLVVAASWAANANAVETSPLDGEPVRLDITDATSVVYNVNNRNTRPGDVERHIDDDWGVWYDRLNVQASWKSWQAGLRLDSALFYSAPDPTSLSLDLLRERHGGVLPATYTADDAQFFVQKETEASRELSTRYVSWLYPAKYYVGYTSRDIEATVGDFYSQLGRGLVLSVRKLDELSSDTTIRGARVTGRLKVGSFRVRITGLGGVLNPLRIDEASGRYLGTTKDVTPGLVGIAEAGMPRAVQSPFDTVAIPTYSPDQVVAGQIEGGTNALLVGVQGSLLTRTFVDLNGTPSALSPGAVRSARDIGTTSVSATVPDLGGHGAFYLEAALQNLSYPSEINATDLPHSGYAIYASLNLEARPLTITAEAKNYRRFFPLLANADLARAPEFSAAQYSSPPTTEAFWVDTEFENFNTCVSGGRIKADVQVGPRETIFAWAGRYLSWAESVSNEQCRTSGQNLNSVWDLATGFEISSQSRRSRASLTFGSRFDDLDRSVPSPVNGEGTTVFYREIYTRYDVLEWLGGPFALKLQGWERRRHQTLGGPAQPWSELQNLIALDWAPRLTVGGGFDYTGNPEFPGTYFNGFFTYNLTPSSNVSFFGGQRRGGLRCVSGVCRVYAPFEGVRVDATFRF